MIDIGIASYQNASSLNATISALRDTTKSEWRLLIVDNNSPDPRVRSVIEKHRAECPNIFVEYLSENIGYVGAVNKFLEWSTSEFVVYCDNDCTVSTPGWDLLMQQVLNANPSVAMTFGFGHGAGAAYPIRRETFTEVLWGIGCFWMLRKAAQEQVGLFDTTLGHQEEVDFQTRLRMAGWKMAQLKEVSLHHKATASRSPEDQQRINDGIVNWVNKWVKYFCGTHMDYFSDNVLRFEDWPPNALYLEEWYQQFLPGLNANPDVVVMEGRNYDLCKVPRMAVHSTNAGAVSLYRDRII